MIEPSAVGTGEIHVLKKTPEIVYLDIVIKLIDFNYTFLQFTGGIMRTMKFTPSIICIQHKRIYDQRMLSFVKTKAAGRSSATLDYVEMNNNLQSVVDCMGATLLHYSAKEGNAISTQWLLDRGLEADAETKHGETPLMLALQNDDSFCVLLKANANIDHADNRGEIVLQKVGAKLTRDSPIPGALLMKLLDKCETVEEAAIKLLDTRCPLWLAVLIKNSEVLKLVLERGIDVDARDPIWNYSALHLAVKFHDLEGVELLLEYGADVNARDRTGFTPIWYLQASQFCRDEQVGILKLLLDRGADMTYHNGGWMQIEKVLEYGSEEAVRLVEQTNIDLHARNGFGDTLLCTLARNLNLGNFELLQDRILEVNTRSKDGSTALHSAATRGQGGVQFLLDRGANVNIQDRHGRTPLYYAVTCKNTKGIELLLERRAGARIQIFDELFRNRHYFDSIQLILAHVAKLEATGVIINKGVSRIINSDLRLRTSLDAYIQQFEQMKQIVICDSVTAFTLLTETESKLLARLRNQELVSILKNVDYKHTKGTYYYKKLQERIETILRKIELRERVAAILCEFMNIFYDSHPTITDEIISYLGESDLQRLSRI